MRFPCGRHIFRKPLAPFTLNLHTVRSLSGAARLQMVHKRKATSPVRPLVKKQRTASDGEASASTGGFDHSRIAEEVGVIQRKYYPPEMSNERCERYNNNEILRPLSALNQKLKETEAARRKIEPGDCVVHWFKRDLRTLDNRALRAASERARDSGIPLVCMYLVSPEDYEAHCTSAARVDFEMRTLQVLKQDLAEKNIPLYTATVPKRKDVISHILEKSKGWGAKHVFCNIEYEVDELRRETKLIQTCLDAGISFTALHDDVVVPPGTLSTGSGKQYSVYSPWYKAWVKHLHEHTFLLDPSDAPAQNSDAARQQFTDIFDTPLPQAPDNRRLSAEDGKRLESFWPAGEHEAHERLERFLQKKIGKYKDERNFPAANYTSGLSVHFSAGTLAARSAIRAARDSNSSKKLDGGNPGIVTWISEIAWRDFYKHVLAHWPYVCMGKPFKYEYADIEWSYDTEAFKRWTSGTTGFPSWMRPCDKSKPCPSFLAKDLLVDWRMGEKWFMEHLIDGDFASNNGGWGFSASTGVDPQPYFRIFNPLLQSEKFDVDGDYIRKWVPELAAIKGKAIHDPYGRGAAREAEKAGYPRPMVNHSEARAKALERYKNGLGRNTANVGGGVHN